MQCQAWRDGLGQVPVRIGERSYRLSCREGEEARLEQLSGYINEKMDELAEQHGQIGEERLMVMAMLLITDELFDARDTAEAKTQPDAPESGDEGADDAGEAA